MNSSNHSFFIKYLDLRVVSINTHILNAKTFEWIQTLFTVADLIQAYKTFVAPSFDSVPLNTISLQIPQGVSRSDVNQECFYAPDENDITLDPGCPLSSLGTIGTSSKKPLIIKATPDLRRFQDQSFYEHISIFNRQKKDALLEHGKKYLLRTQNWECVTVIEKRQAITFAHKPHDTLEIGKTLKIYSLHPAESPTEYKVKVIKINVNSDYILLESNVDLCEGAPILGLTGEGRKYVQLGLSATSQNEDAFCISNGVVSSSRVNSSGHILGSAGANPGDSGGPCFDEDFGELIGINVGCEIIPINPDQDTLSEIDIGNNNITSVPNSLSNLSPLTQNSIPYTTFAQTAATGLSPTNWTNLLSIPVLSKRQIAFSMTTEELLAMCPLNDVRNARIPAGCVAGIYNKYCLDLSNLGTCQSSYDTVVAASYFSPLGICAAWKSGPRSIICASAISNFKVVLDFMTLTNTHAKDFVSSIFGSQTYAPCVSKKCNWSRNIF